MTYWEVSARSKRWGLNQRRNFNSEKEALDFAKEIAKGLPLRMRVQGERRMDEPYKSAKGFKLKWNRFEGVVIEPTQE